MKYVYAEEGASVPVGLDAIMITDDIPGFPDVLLDVECFCHCFPFLALFTFRAVFCSAYFVLILKIYYILLESFFQLFVIKF